jgi:hypothetical protein
MIVGWHGSGRDLLPYCASNTLHHCAALLTVVFASADVYRILDCNFSRVPK